MNYLDRSLFPQLALKFVFLWLLLLPHSVSGNTVVRFETVLGNFEVQLYSQSGPERSTPLTVANFLTYVENGAYDDSFIHRSLPGFVLQGGGFGIDLEANQLYQIPTLDPVVNEPGNSNVRGTIAMAKVAGDPDSATSQWFFNLNDNSDDLDEQNEGFTVFGHVLGDGMEVVDALAAVQTYDASEELGGAFTNFPLLEPYLEAQYLLLITRISVVPVEMKPVRRAEEGVELSWGGTGDTAVTVLRTENLLLEEWDVVAENITSGTFVDPDPPDTVFYRIVE